MPASTDVTQELAAGSGCTICWRRSVRGAKKTAAAEMHLLIFFISNLLGATGAAIISGAKRSRRHADRSQGCFRVRAAIPATICIATPNNHQQPTTTVQITGRSSSNTTTYTEANAAAAARNLPAPPNNLTRSTLGPNRAAI